MPISELSGIHHAYYVRVPFGGGNASRIRVFGPDLYRTVLYWPVPLGGNEPLVNQEAHLSCR